MRPKPNPAREHEAVTIKACCDDWEPQICKINGFIVLQAVRSGNLSLYDGKPFLYCPWCGKERPTEQGLVDHHCRDCVQSFRAPHNPNPHAKPVPCVRCKGFNTYEAWSEGCE